MYSPDNQFIVSGSKDQTIKIWSSLTFKLITTLYGHTDTIFSLWVLFNSSNIVSGSQDNTIKIWKYTELSYYTNFRGHTNSINDLIFNSKNGDLISCSKDETIRVWDMNSNQTKYLNQEHNRSCLSLYLLNNYNLVSTSEDKSIKIWNTDLFYNISIIKGYNNNNNNIDKVVSQTNDINDNYYSNLIDQVSEYCKQNNQNSKCKILISNLN